MASSSTSLSLFPPITASKPLLSISKPSKSVDAQGAAHELKAVAIQIAPNHATSPAVRSGNDHFRHSLFCEPSGRPSTGSHPINQTAISRRQPQRSESDLSKDSTASGCKNVFSNHEEGDAGDVLPELPENTNFATGYSPRKNRTKQRLKPKMIDVPPKGAKVTLDSSQMKEDDRVSPLPDKTNFVSSLSQDLEYPASLSERSDGTTLVRNNSGASSYPPRSPPAMRSMFPQYDPSRALCDQNYYPASSSPPVVLSSQKISKAGSPAPSQSALSLSDTAQTLVDGYEHIRRADSSDVQELWNASCGHFPVAGRKVHLGLHQPHDRGLCLVIGISAETGLYSMEKDLTDQLVIRKHCPGQSSFTPVTELVLPESTEPRKNGKREEIVTIFPQMAGVHALESASSSLSAAKIATFDPSAHSPEAARLAHDAVSQAHAKYRCRLVRANRKRDSLGAVTASYSLEHPSLGTFAITVTKSTAGSRHARDPRAKIMLHHSSATSAAIAAETLALACVDFSRDACILDTPALLALEGPYVIDTVVASLLAVAAIENDALVNEAMSFDPPPKSSVAASRGRPTRRKSSASMSTAKSKGWLKRKSKKEKKLQEEQVELPALTQGALALLGLSFKTAVFVLETGVKVTAGVVVGVSHLVSKT